MCRQCDEIINNKKNFLHMQRGIVIISNGSVAHQMEEAMKLFEARFKALPSSLQHDPAFLKLCEQALENLEIDV